MREIATWSKECLRCGIQYTDMWVHDSYVCSHPPARADPDNESALSWPSSAASSADSEDLYRQYLEHNYPDGNYPDGAQR